MKLVVVAVIMGIICIGNILYNIYVLKYMKDVITSAHKPKRKDIHNWDAIKKRTINLKKLSIIFIVIMVILLLTILFLPFQFI